MKKSILFLTIMLFVASTVFAVSFSAIDNGVKRAPTAHGPQVYNPDNNRAVITIGAGSTTSVSTYDTPFGTYYEDGQNQFLFTAAELTTAGLTAGDITGIGWNVASASSELMNGFNIELKHTAATATTSFETGFTNVYTGTHTAIAGWNDFVFSTNFTWDGTSNVLVKVCFDNDGYASNSSVYEDPTPLATNASAYNDGTAGCTDPFEYAYSERPQTRFSVPDIFPVLGSTPVTPFNFGSVTAPVTQTITLTNIGAGVVDIAAASDITISGDSEFTLSNIVGTFPATIPADVITFDVTFTPTTNASFTADVNVVWDVIESTDLTFLGSRCVITQPFGATLENEPCGTDVNGGCNMDAGTETWTPIALGETIFGNFWSDGSTRDTDWYELILTEPMTVTWDFISDLTFVSGYIENSITQDCALVTAIAPAVTVEPCVAGQVVVNLLAGTHWFFAGDSDYAGAPCPGGNYTVTASGVPWCAPPTDMIETSLTQTSATLEWTPAGIETEWEIEWGIQGFTPDAVPAQGITVSGLTTTSYPIAITLEDSTSYDWYVKAVCSALVSSVDAGPKTFTTLDYCPTPSGLAISNLTTASVTLDWDAMPNAINYDWEIVPAGNLQGVGVIDSGTGIVPNTASSVLLTGATGYDFRVLSTCNDPARSVASLWSAPFTFFTPITIPYSQNFDGVTAPALPNGWTTIGNGLATTSTTQALSALNSARLYHTTTLGTCYLISPSISTAVNVTRVNFWAYGGAGYQIDVGIMTDPTDDATFTSTQTINVPAAWTEYTISFNNMRVDSYVAFLQNNNFQYVYIDDVVWEELPSCPEPSGLNATGITPTSADLSWVESGSATLWDIELGATPFTPTGTPTHSGVTNPYTISTLTQVTNYDFYVRADCGTDVESVWAGPYNFQTTQAAGTCGTWTIDLIDSYGDGWNGGMADLYVDGVLIHDDMTVSTGSGPITYTFETNENGFVSVDYTAGDWSSENEYYIYDHNSALVTSSGVGTTPSDIGGPFPNPTTGLGTCATLPIFSCDPASFDFGSLFVGFSTPVQTFTISNVGVGTLTITGISITGTDSGEFALTDLNSYSVDLTSNTITVDVAFAPTSVGVKSAFLSITDTVTRVTHDIPLDGEGIVPAQGDLISDPFVVGALPFNATGSTIGFFDNYGPYGDAIGLTSLLCTDISYFTTSTLGTSPDVVFEITLGAPTELIIDLCASGFDTALALVSGDGLDPEDVLLIDDDSYLSGAEGCAACCQSFIHCSVPVPAGTYYIIVGGYGSGSGDYDLTVSEVVAPTAPINVLIVNDGTDVTITWDAVVGATSYIVYSSTDPYGIFTVDATGIFTAEQWVASSPAVNTYYQVTAATPAGSTDVIGKDKGDPIKGTHIDRK